MQLHKSKFVYMKIINLGLPKTGTTTLISALEFFDLKRGLIADIENPNVDFFVGDYVHTKPIEFWIDTFPDAVFLLTVRKDPETWLRSLMKWSEKKDQFNKVKQFRKELYGHEMPHGNEDAFLEKYHSHNYNVIKSVRNRRFTMLCWELLRNEEWKTLCKAIGMPVPNRPFPHLNKQIY